MGKQNFLEDMKELFETVTKTIKNVTKHLTKTMAESYKVNNKALASLSGNLLEIKNDRG